jgi:hypothetical protein
MEDIFNKIAESIKPKIMETETKQGKSFIYTTETQICVEPQKNHVVITIVKPNISTFVTITKLEAWKLGEILNQI